MGNPYCYILIMAGVTYLVRALPLTLLQRPLKNRFLYSFLYYVPYVTLAVMTFPAILEATASPLAGAAALAVGILFAWMGLGLFPVACLSCGVVFFLELFL